MMDLTYKSEEFKRGYNDYKNGVRTNKFPWSPEYTKGLYEAQCEDRAA